VKILKNLLKTIKNPYKVITLFSKRGFLKSVPDELYIKLFYRGATGEVLNLKSPVTYNEKIQWLKLYDRNPLYTKLVDKYKVREYIANTIGDEYLIPLHGVWNDFNEIDFDILPNQFVLKCTHDSGGIVICKDKSLFNIDEARKKINKSLKRNFYYYTREWPYKNVKPRIICESYIDQDDGEELRDYRFFCFDGKPKFIAVDFSITDKSKTRRNLYDLDWNLLDAEISYPKEENIKVNKPKKLNKMIELSQILASNFPHARVDLYYIHNQIFFGEITFFHQNGIGTISPKDFNVQMGKWIKIPPDTRTYNC